MGLLNSCPDFFSKGNGEKLSLRQPLLPQKIMLTATKSELSNFFQGQTTKFYRFYILK